MYSDIFDLEQLGGAGRNAAASASVGTTETTAPVLAFKAGKIDLTWQADVQKYACLADTARGEVRLVWKEAGLQWQWYDRREKLVKDTIRLRDLEGSTFERVPLASNIHKDDRVYVWTKKTGEYSMYWMQDAVADKDDEIVASINQYLADPQSAAPVGVTAMDTDTTAAAGSTAAGATGTGATTAGESQVDALSSILENLGMPQSGAGAVDTVGTAAAAGDTTARTLTLADLQGAMAGIPQAADSAAASGPGPELSQVVTPAAITALLQNEQAKERLIQFLPEDQRTAEHLEENLRSPQVQQTLRSLTQALLPDDTGNQDGFYSVLANFSLDPADGQAAMLSNNPIQAFLDCVLAKVEKDKQEESKE